MPWPSPTESESLGWESPSGVFDEHSSFRTFQSLGSQTCLLIPYWNSMLSCRKKEVLMLGLMNPLSLQAGPGHWDSEVSPKDLNSGDRLLA